MNRTCGWDPERLSAWLDGALAEDERRATAEHVACCPQCEEWVAALRRVDDGVRDLPAPAWTDATASRFASGVMARIAATREASARPPATSVAPPVERPSAAAITRPIARPSLPDAAPAPGGALRRGRGPRALPRLGWLAGTLSAAAALLLLLAGTDTNRSRGWVGTAGTGSRPRALYVTDPATGGGGRFSAAARNPALPAGGGTDPSGTDPHACAPVVNGKGGTWVTFKGGDPNPGKGGAVGVGKAGEGEPLQNKAAQGGQEQVALDSQGFHPDFTQKALKTHPPGNPVQPIVGILTGQGDQETVLGVHGSNVVSFGTDWRSPSCRFQAQTEMQYRGVDSANPALAVDPVTLADKSLAASEALMTLLVNASESDALGMPDFRESILANGVDDRVRVALSLNQDPDTARPLAGAQVLLVRLANGVENPQAEELDELKRVIVGKGLIEEVRRSRNRIQQLSRTQLTLPNQNDSELIEAK